MSAFGKIIDAVVTVERNEIVRSGSSRSYGYLRLRLDEQIPVLPGQFAMLKAHGIYEPLLRRAMAFYRCELSELGEPAGNRLDVDFIYQILGRGTQAIAKLEPGDKVDFLGSLGNTYDIGFANGREVLLVAGGVGSPALFMLAEELLKLKVPTRLFIGAMSHGDLCGLDDFTSLLSKENVVCATVDGSYGEKGFVTAPLERHLKAQAGNPQAGKQMIYSCGPDPMLHAVAKLAEQYEVPAQLSLEAPMGCGFGVCVGCAVAVKADCQEGFVFKKVCTDGPVFWSRELHF